MKIILDQIKSLSRKARGVQLLHHIKFESAITQTNVEKFIPKLHEIKSSKPQVILLSVNTAYGSIAQTQILVETLQRLQHQLQVPLITYIDDFGLGVGYYLASCGTQVNANPFSLIGNITSSHNQIGLSKILKKNSIQYQQYGTNKLILDSFQEITQQQKDYNEKLQKYEQQALIELIKNNRQQIYRDYDYDKVLGAQVYNSQQALEYKLVDQIYTFEEYHARFYNKFQIKENLVEKYNQIIYISEAYNHIRKNLELKIELNDQNIDLAKQIIKKTLNELVELDLSKFKDFMLDQLNYDLKNHSL
ncbi:hypothetical protein pb186bvf_013632 [Paramecium bursaria]